MKPTGAGVVVVYRGSEDLFLILLQDKEYNNWSFPKGRREEGEEPIDNALRELKEETGIINVEILDFPPIKQKYSFPRKGVEVHVFHHYFIGIVKNKDVIIQQEEIFEYKWATYEEAMSTFGFKKEDRQKVLKQAKEYLDMVK